MPIAISIEDLLAYTDWQRSSWYAWFQDQDPSALTASTGPHTDGRFPTIGALVRHIFSAELRYVERIRGAELSDASAVPTTHPAALFTFGATGRSELRALLGSLPSPSWDEPLEVPLLNRIVRLSPRKILLHLVTHEIRHWAQVGTLLRELGWKVPAQDLLLAPVCGEAISL